MLAMLAMLILRFFVFAMTNASVHTPQTSRRNKEICLSPLIVIWFVTPKSNESLDPRYLLPNISIRAELSSLDASIQSSKVFDRALA